MGRNVPVAAGGGAHKAIGWEPLRSGCRHPAEVGPKLDTRTGVLCNSCQLLQDERRRAGLREPVPSAPATDQVGMLLCHRCRAVLPAVDGVDTMLHKLSQLAQFGLGAGSGPLLTRARKET